jgi:hypothetical protein
VAGVLVKQKNRETQSNRMMMDSSVEGIAVQKGNVMVQ